MSEDFGDIPIESVREARNALADEYLTLKLELEKPSVMTFLHKKRIKSRVLHIEQHINRLDIWLKEVGK